MTAPSKVSWRKYPHGRRFGILAGEEGDYYIVKHGRVTVKLLKSEVTFERD